MRVFLLMLSLITVPVAAAEHLVTVTSPSDGKEHTASAGDVVWSKRTARVSVDQETTYVLDERALGGGFFSTKGTADKGVGSRLIGVETKSGVKACEINATDLIVGRVRACFTDEDGDGAFDHYSYKENASLGPLRQPARYHRVVSSEETERSNFQSQVTYLGVSAGALSLSYREFSDDMARPAFTETLSIPLNPVYPQSVRFKGVEMKVVKIDGLGLRYQIVATSVGTPE